jgi:two-component system, OmpR family, phosphate regulon sensor histidine kinase PhoR
MNEGAVTLSIDGIILYCNNKFAELLKVPLESVIGSAIFKWAEKA